MTSSRWDPFPLRVSVDDLDLIIRPVTAADKSRIVEGLRAISPETSYRRFFTPTFYPSDEQLRYLTDIDGERHMALGAVDASKEGAPGVGVARYIRLSEEPTVAEAAILVIDAYQRRGVGSILLVALSRYAWHHGIRTFRGYVLPDNRAFLRYLQALGAHKEQVEDGILQLDLPVLGRAEDLPETPAAQRARWAWRTVDTAWPA
jgi:RimJ/RimL family protein N-acetyltransferase